MTPITTHVLDAVLGKPAAGIAVLLELQDSAWIAIGHGVTDTDGRCRDLCSSAAHGTYRLTFSVGEYFAAQSRKSIYPEITITFTVADDRHHHIPLLLSDNSYTTYRGS